MYIQLGWVKERAIQDRSLFVPNPGSKNPLGDMTRRSRGFDPLGVVSSF